MVARANHALQTDGPHTPWPDIVDADDVLLALEKARGLEADGDVLAAVQWLHRAADQSLARGNRPRAEVITRAALELASTIESAPDKKIAAPSSVPTLNVRGRRSMQVPRPERLPDVSPSSRPSSPPSPESLRTQSVPPMLAALISSMPPFSSRAPSPSSAAPVSSSAAQSAIAPPPSDAAISAPAAEHQVTAHESKSLTDRRVRIASIRVAVMGAIAKSKTFSVERLGKGEAVPPGATEAMLVITGEIDGSLVIETHVALAGSTQKS